MAYAYWNEHGEIVVTAPLWEWNEIYGDLAFPYDNGQLDILNDGSAKLIAELKVLGVEGV